MKTAFKILIFSALSISFLSASRTDISLSKTVVLPDPTDSISVNILVTMSRKDFEKRIGRKLGLFERMVLKKTKKRLRKNPGWVMDRRKMPIDAAISLFSSIAGVAAVFKYFTDSYMCEDNCPKGPGWLVSGILLMLLGMIIGACTLSKISKEPENLGGRFEASMGIVIPLVLLLLFLMLLILV